MSIAGSSLEVSSTVSISVTSSVSLSDSVVVSFSCVSSGPRVSFADVSSALSPDDCTSSATELSVSG